MASQAEPTAAPGTFLVEGFWPSGAERSFFDATTRLEVSLDRLLGRGVSKGAVAATFVPNDEAAYWVVDAPSREVVSQACEAAGLRVERIVGALEVRAGIGTVPSERPGSPAGVQASAARKATAQGERHHGRRMTP